MTITRNKFKAGNPGRPKGASNKVTKPLRQIISDFLSANFETIQTDFKKLPPRDRAKVYSDLLQYGIPKLSSSSMEIDFNKFSDDQLDEIIDKITKTAIK
jgi:hypothetical protein